MASEPRKFDFWWKGAPVVQGAATGSFAYWWKGAPVIQATPSLFLGEQVGSGGLTLGGEAPFTHNTNSLDYGGLTLGGAAGIAVTFQKPNAILPQVIVYVGDGTGARDIAACSYMPLFVWVLGKVVSTGREIGAFKTRSMPSNKSQPWARRAPATSTTRITALNTDGFSVGADLNSTGDSFIAVVWPDIPGVTAEGSYSGSGSPNPHPNSHMLGDNPAGQLNFNDGHPFTSADIGRTIYRASDNAIIAVITGMVDATHVAATISISAFFNPGEYYIRPRTVPIGFEADLVILAADTDLGVTYGILPIYLAPGFGLTQGDIPELRVGWDSGTIVSSLDGTGLNPSYAGVPAGDTNLYVANVSASTGWDATGVTFYWFAIKADPTSPYADSFSKIDYTGTNSVPRDIESVRFWPEFLAIFGQVETPKAKAAGAEPTGAALMLRFQDNAVVVDTGITFISDGFHNVSNNFNADTKKYRAFFLRSALSLNGLGLRLGGSAEVVYKPQGGANTYTVEGIGGLQLLGSAIINAILTGRYIVEASGGLTLGGTASAEHFTVYTVTPSGGLTLGGTGGGIFTPGVVGGITYTCHPTGGLTLGGRAVCSSTGPQFGGGGSGRFFPEPSTYRVQTTHRWRSCGVLWVFGYATTARAFAPVASGGLAVSGPLNRVLAYMRHEYAPPVALVMTGMSGKARTSFYSARPERAEEQDREMVDLGVV